MPTHYCTVPDVRELLNQTTPTNTANNPLIRTCITTASTLIKNFIRRDISFSNHVEYHDTIELDNYLLPENRRFKIFLKNTPIALTEPFTVTYEPLDNLTAVPLVIDEDYRIDASTGKLTFMYSRMTAFPDAIKVEYTSGYPTSAEPDDITLVDVPDDIRMATALQATTNYRKIVNENVGNGKKNSKAGATEYPTLSTGLIPQSQALVKHYVRLFTGG